MTGPRPNGATLVRDALGNKECVRCLRWRPEGEFHRGAGRALDGLKVWCKDCTREYTREHSVWTTLRREFGLTRAQYEEMVHRQGGACAIPACGATEPGGKGRWHVDHDHSCCPGRKSCGRCVRGLLCFACNIALGYLKDNPARLRGAADYLEASR